MLLTLFEWTLSLSVFNPFTGLCLIYQAPIYRWPILDHQPHDWIFLCGLLECHENLFSYKPSISLSAKATPFLIQKNLLFFCFQVQMVGAKPRWQCLPSSICFGSLSAPFRTSFRLIFVSFRMKVSLSSGTSLLIRLLKRKEVGRKEGREGGRLA